MPRPTRLLSALGLLAALCAWLLLPGCVKYKQTLTVMPDGSGKVDVVMGMSNAQRTAPGAPADPFAALSVPELARNPQGFVAFTEPRAEDRDGYRIVTVTCYFEDIGELTFGSGMGQGGGAADAVTYDFAEDRLTVRRPLVGQTAAAFRTDPVEIPDGDLRAVLAQGLQGMELSERFVLPGPVTEAGPLAVDGRSAEASVAGAAALDRYDELVGTWAGVDQLEIRFEPAAWPAEAEAAWKQELADAKANWARLARGGG